MSSTVLETNVPAYAYHLLASRRPQDVISYPLCEALSHRMRGLIMRSINIGERGLPCRVPRLISMDGVWPWGVTNSVVAPFYRFVMILMKSYGSPKNSRVLTSWSWSADGKAPLKSK